MAASTWVKGLVSLTNVGFFYRENISQVQRCQGEPDHPQISPTAVSWMSHIPRHCHSVLLHPLFVPSQPETLSDFKNIPLLSSLFDSAFIFAPMLSNLATQKEGNIILSQATSKPLTHCFVWQPNQTFHRDGLKRELKAQS